MDLVPHGFTEDEILFANEVYRIYAHPIAFDLGPPKDMRTVDTSKDTESSIFLAQVWFANRCNDPITSAAIVYRVGSQEPDDESLFMSSNEHAICQSHFLAYATEAVADAWSGDIPLTDEQVRGIAHKAMDYAWKILYSL
jgi:hypothetical protein